jgi:vacuolar-type H+-ATPase subunit F/Vma7
MRIGDRVMAVGSPFRLDGTANDRKISKPSDVAEALREAQGDQRSVAVMLIRSECNDRFMAVQIGES